MPKAKMSPCKQYRYWWSHTFDEGPSVAFMMFNPSTADDLMGDATSCKCIGFAKRWGYGRVVLLNLFAIRGRDPRTPSRVADPIGPMNNFYIAKQLEGCRELIYAWGCSQYFTTHVMRQRPAAIAALLNSRDIVIPTMCLGHTKNGSPRHPLMLPYSTPRVAYLSM